MQGDFKSYFSIYGNRLLIIVVDTPIIPKDDNVIQPIGILHRRVFSVFVEDESNRNRLIK